VKIHKAKMSAKDLRLAIIVSRWNELVTKELLEGALDEIERLGGDDVEVVWVPGTWEAPLAAQTLLSQTNCPDGIVVLGCIIQGETPHAKLLGSDVAGALMGLQVSHGVPVSWGVLTPDTIDQALDRSGVKHGNKGREAVLAVVEMVSVIKSIKS
jgi:6,7-dimethyl-8-ribityllumazine synthase